MTEEEILNRYCEKECKDFLQCGYSNKEHCPFHKGINYGLIEGRKEGYEQGKNNERELQCGKKNYEKDVARLEKENAELKAENKQIIERERVVPEHYLIEMIAKNKELKAQIEEQKAHCKAVDEVNEKMKCCGNCRHNGSDNEIGENGDYTDYTCIQCDDFSTKENPYPNWELVK